MIKKKIGYVFFILFICSILQGCKSKDERCSYSIDENNVMTVNLDNKYEYTFNNLYIYKLKNRSAYELYIYSCPDYIGTEDDWFNDIINNRFGDDGRAYYNVTFYDINKELYKQYSYARNQQINYEEDLLIIGWDFQYWQYNNKVFNFDLIVNQDMQIYSIYKKNENRCLFEIKNNNMRVILDELYEYEFKNIKNDLNLKTAYDIYRYSYPNYIGDEEQWYDDIINKRFKEDGLAYYTVTFFDKDKYEFISYNYPRNSLLKIEPGLDEKNLKFAFWTYQNEEIDYTKPIINDMNIYPFYYEKHSISIISNSLGEVDINTNEAFFNDKIKLGIKPNLGYKISNIYINDVLREEVELLMPDDNIEIKVEFVKEYLELPIININMDNDLSDLTKDEYVQTNISVENAGKYNLGEVVASVKGRGNWSWFNEKKPFRIKFDKKQDLFGFGKSKHWVLLANYCDVSLSRNDLAMKLTTLFTNIPYTPDAIDVELYVNNEYLGVYSLCEKIRVEEERVNIESTFGEIDTGYLIEYDAYAKGMNSNRGIPGNEGIEGVTYFKVPGMKYWFTVHSPDPDDYLLHDVVKYKEQINYLKTYLINSFDAIKSKDFNRISTLIDVNSFVDMYIINELFKNTDVGWSSFYMCKEKNGKLFCTALWDFEFSAGLNRGDNTYKNIYAGIEFDKNLDTLTSSELFINLVKCEEFSIMVKARWKELTDDIKSMINTEISEKRTKINSMDRNFIKWNLFSRKLLCEEKEVSNYTSWIQHINYLEDWLLKRIDWLNNYWK